MTTLLAKLRAVGREVDKTVFLCSGELSLPADSAVQVFYKSGSSAVNAVSFPRGDDAPPDAIEQLVSACVPATFGKGSEEVLDKTYRDAVALDTTKFMTSFQLSEHPQIQSEIQSILASTSEDDSLVVARLYKLNVYGAGGFFKAHRDTPRGDARMFGTLVVCLPSPFEGGDFVVKSHDGFAQVFPWSVKSSGSSIQWCAFYSDCEHEVLPVTSGHRVTLTYLLESQPAPSATDPGVAHAASSVEQILREAMMDQAFAPYGAKLGFGLKHAYVVTQDGPIPMLKGADRGLKDTLDRLGLHYEFVPVYGDSDYDAQKFKQAQDATRRGGDGRYDGQMGRYHHSSVDVSEFELKGVEEPPPLNHGDPFYEGDGASHLLVGSWTGFQSIIDMAPDEEYTCDGLDFENLDLHTTKEVLWIAPPVQFPLEKHGATYGNEPTMSSYYAAASFIVWMPSWAKRSKKRVSTGGAGADDGGVGGTNGAKKSKLQ